MNYKIQPANEPRRASNAENRATRRAEARRARRYWTRPFKQVELHEPCRMTARVTVPVVYSIGSRTFLRLEDDKHKNVILVDRETARVLNTVDGRPLTRTILNQMLRNRVVRRSVAINHPKLADGSASVIPAQNLTFFERVSLRVIRPVPTEAPDGSPRN